MNDEKNELKVTPNWKATKPNDFESKINLKWHIRKSLLLKRIQLQIWCKITPQSLKPIEYAFKNVDLLHVNS